MTIVALRTDNPEAEIYIMQNAAVISQVSWTAHRQLLETIHVKLTEILKKEGTKFTDINGLIFYEGPGSFTGLRIGASVANALAAALKVPIVSSGQEAWLSDGYKLLHSKQSKGYVEPVYGSPAHTTKSK